MAEITQADREAAAQRLTSPFDGSPIETTQERIRAGGMDSHPWVQAFAAHRIAAEKALLDLPEIGTQGNYTREGMNISCEIINHVEGWLEVRFSDGSDCIVRPSSFTALAAALECGEHKGTDNAND